LLSGIRGVIRYLALTLLLIAIATLAIYVVSH